MMDQNSVNVTGRIVRDFELKYTGNGTPVGNTAVAISESYEGKDRTSFLDLTLWGKKAEDIGKYLTKGRRVALTGRLRQETWTTPEGQKRSKIGIIVEHVVFLDAPTKSNDERPAQSRTTESDEDIPF